MEPDRQDHTLNNVSRRQAGITTLGFIILVAVFGIIGLGALKLTPMYLQNMRLSQVLDDLREELSGTVASPASIRTALIKRLDVESLSIPLDDVKISQGRNGYQVRVQYENRTPFFANIWFLVVFDKQVEIQR
jgi:hypothetical protein